MVDVRRSTNDFKLMPSEVPKEYFTSKLLIKNNILLCSVLKILFTQLNIIKTYFNR